ncbi:HET-domain-containing protein [Venturia nashicola]|uniref:HET-domain-containing protein n=1 Tax=Venturia nashicola TaxID=86259 RepID=A0A4Z1NT12_9PEZI|nr:HET-domain-containing protein [Venturia nashicola]
MAKHTRDRSLISRAVHRVLKNKHYHLVAQEDPHEALLVQRHQYEPLPPGEEYTRVVVLQPAEDLDDELVCQIKSVKYQELGVHFEAISYAHDHSIFPETLVCVNGRFHSNITISPNLSNALRHLRLPNATRTLWVDAICINQEDAQEKSSQINQIGAIFAAAQRVSVWLGLPDEETADAFDFCHVLADFAISCGLSKEHEFNIKYTDWLSPGPKRARTSLACDSVYQQRGLAFKRFLERPWFHCRWVIQEMFFGRAVWVHCGASMIVADTLALAIVTSHVIKAERARLFKTTDVFWCDNIDKNTLGLAHELVRAESGSTSGIQRHKKQSKRKQYPILHLLAENEDARCADPRDVIGSQLGMSTMSSFYIDYSASVGGTYIDFACACIHSPHPKQSPYKIIHHAVRWKEDSSIPDTRDHEQELNLPSWVPDWRRKKPGLLFTSHPSVFRAATHLDARFSVSRDKRRIIAAGVRVGAIAKESWSATQSLQAQWVGEKYTDNCARYQLLGLKRIFENILAINGGGILASTLIAGGRPSEIRQALSPHLACTTLEDIFDSLIAHLQLDDNVKNWSESEQDYFRCFQIVMEQRTLFVVGDGRGTWIGIGPQGLRGGDMLVVLMGAETPFLVRPVRFGSEVLYEVVGECYVHGLMKGEVSDLMLCEEKFVIV